MSRGKKKTLIDPVTANNVERSIQIKLSEIAKRLGTTVPSLLESYGDAETVIEKFDSGRLQLLNEEDSE